MKLLIVEGQRSATMGSIWGPSENIPHPPPASKPAGIDEHTINKHMPVQAQKALKALVTPLSKDEVP